MHVGFTTVPFCLSVYFKPWLMFRFYENMWRNCDKQPDLSSEPGISIFILDQVGQPYSVLYCTVLYCTVLYCTVLYWLYSTVLYCSVLYCYVLYYSVLYCTLLYFIVRYCTVLHSSVLYCPVMYLLDCIVLYFFCLCI